MFFFFFFQAEDGIRDGRVTGVQTCALPILSSRHHNSSWCRVPGDPSRRAEYHRRAPRRSSSTPRRTHGTCREESSQDRKSTRLNSSHPSISYAVFCLKKKND